MGLQQEQEVRWGGKASAVVRGVTADRVWPLLAEFGSMDRWMPTVATCRLMGVAGAPGCLRYCASAGGERWAKEVLKSIDHVGRKMCYEMTESSMGWRYYEAAMEVVDSAEEGGCRIEWTFRMDPVHDRTEEGIADYIGYALGCISKRMEEFLCGGAGGDMAGDFADGAA
ncbi:unnamed protein product [Victoria cruziana]